MKKLLAVGPLPPPPSGSTVSFQVFIEAIADETEIQLDIIDTSPKQIKNNTSITSLGNLLQAAKFFVQFCAKVRQAERAIIFGSNGFLLSMTPLMVFAAKIMGRPCYVRPFGGSLDQFHNKLPTVLQKMLRFGLLQADGVIVETKLLYEFFHKMGGEKVHYLPGYRPIDEVAAIDGVNQSVHEKSASGVEDSGEKLRLIFISWVRKEKGAFVLLEALRNLSLVEKENIVCDIYGPIVESDRAQFEDEIAETTCASYHGVIDPHDVLPLMQQYNALVFPTFYQGEGQPGVVLETMVAGIPPITTNFRSIPEVVQDGVNGLLVEPENAADVTTAIQKLYHDPALRHELGQKNRELAAQYDTKVLIPALIAIVANDGSASGISPLESVLEASVSGSQSA